MSTTRNLARYAAYLFDMDGVLTDSEPYMVEASIRMFRQRYGVSPRPEDFVPFFGTGEVGFFGGVAKLHGIDLDMAACRQCVFEHYRAVIRDGMVALADAVEFVAAVRASGAKAIVATSAPRLKADITLEHIGLPPDAFDAVIAGDDITHNKPHPQIFDLAARRADADPSECLAIEDSPSGLKSATGAGCRTLGLMTAHSAEELRAAGADWVARDLASVPDGVFAS